MKFELRSLPYSVGALAPVLSAHAVELHYEKHHRGYLEKLRAEIEGKPEAERELDDLIRTTVGSVFNNAAQLWNHDFFWRSLRPAGGQASPKGLLLNLIKASYGSTTALKRELAAAANAHFGSGWAWLVQDRNRRLRVESTHDAENPLVRGRIPLLGIDVWEHAYYPDYQNERARYVGNVVDHLLDWKFATANLESASLAPRELPPARTS
jgi:Fe-Mn family superoxide dismutase